MDKIIGLLTVRDGNDPTFQETLVELFLNTFSSPSWSKVTFRPKMVGTTNVVQRIELEGKGGQSSRVDVTSLSFAAHFSLGVRAQQTFVTENTESFWY